jgi:hypothetical protein
LTFAFVSPEEAKLWVDDYYNTLSSECEPVGYAINPNIAMVTGFMCDRSSERARAMGEEGLKFFGYALGHHYVFGQHEPGKTNIWENYQKNPIAMPIGAEGGCIGTPDEIRSRLLGYEQAGVDQVVFISQAGNNKHEDICSSLDLFARRVMPEFKEREPQRMADKAARIEPVLERAMKRKREPETPAAKRDTTIRASLQL